MKQLLILLTIFSLSGCSYLGGFEDLGQETIQEYNEKLESTNISTNFTNSSVAKALVDSITSLKQLQGELNNLESEINTINTNLDTISQEELSLEAITYLNELNKLTQQSKLFVGELYESTKTWDNYLSSQPYNPQEFTEINTANLTNSLIDPITVFDE